MQWFSWRRPFVRALTFVNDLFLNTVAYEIKIIFPQEKNLEKKAERDDHIVWVELNAEGYPAAEK